MHISARARVRRPNLSSVAKASFGLLFVLWCSVNMLLQIASARGVVEPDEVRHHRNIA